jgi:hypothetical protein
MLVNTKNLRDLEYYYICRYQPKDNAQQYLDMAHTVKEAVNVANHTGIDDMAKPIPPDQIPF